MSRSEFLFYLMESSAGLAVFYGFYALVLQRSTFYRVNRAYLLVTTVIALAIPLIPFGQSVQTVTYSPLPDIDWSQVPKAIGTVQTRMGEQAGLLDYLFWVYLTGVLIAGARFGKHLWYLIHCIRQSVFSKYPGYWQTNTDGKLPTFSFLHYLFWNNSQYLSLDEAQAVLRHEWTHIREKHSWDILCLECLQIGLWFNPFVYLYKLALQGQHEFRADEVAAYGWSRTAYSGLMTHSLLSRLNLPLVQSFNYHSIKQRIVMLRQPASAKSRLLVLLLVLPLTGLIAFACTDEMIPLSAAKGDTTEKTNSVAVQQPRVVMIGHYGSQVRPIDLRQGVSVKDFPEAISLVVVADSALAKNHPEEVRYNVETYELTLVKGRRPVLPATKVQVKKRHEVIDVTEIKKAAQPGDRLIVEIKNVIRLNAQNQIVHVDELAGVKIFSVNE